MSEAVSHVGCTVSVNESAVEPESKKNINDSSVNKEIEFSHFVTSTKSLKFGSLETVFQKDFLESSSYIAKMKLWECSSIIGHQDIIIPMLMAALNLINNTDRYVVSSVLIDIEAYFSINKSTAGLLQTVFLLTYMAFSPPNGYLGDRINRKYILCVGICIWMISTIGGSLVSSNMFVLFVLSRALFGVATASFEILAIPILGDLFKNDQKKRDIGLLIFNLGAPLGTGFSYLIGIISKELEPNDWRFTMRFTPFVLGFVLILIIIAYREPERELTRVVNSETQNSGQRELKSFSSDLKALVHNKTYVLITLCWICCLGSLVAFSWWSATLINYSLQMSHVRLDQINGFKKAYSVLQSVGGAVGLLLPIKISYYYKTKKGIEAVDCYIMAISIFITALFLYSYLLLLQVNVYLGLVLYTLTTLSYNMCWIPLANILLDVLPARLRATGNALNICLLHLVGDSISPYWVGLIADACLNKSNQSKDFLSSLLYCTQMSYYPLVIVSFMASVFALFSSFTFVRDKTIARSGLAH